MTRLLEMALNSAGHDNPTAIAILGAGSWGATLSWLFASAGKDVRLWTRDADKASAVRKSRLIPRPLAVNLPESVCVSASLDETLPGAGIVLFCCTAQSMHEVADKVKEALARHGGPSPILVSAAKGIELDTFRSMTQILHDVMPELNVCALSGPNLAAEVLKGLPTASVVSCKDEPTAQYVQRCLSVSTFRLYSNDDVMGVELGGAFKNIIAIAAGAVDGLQLGSNAKAALMTRGLAEMIRLAVALGAKPTTLAGLSGMGDLVATCYSSLSRNYRLGFNMASGASPEKARESLGATAEGVTTAEAVCELSKKLQIELPIAQQVESTLKGLATPHKAIMTLMSRPLASE